jgi:hypothetical protein
MILSQLLRVDPAKLKVMTPKDRGALMQKVRTKVNTADVKAFVKEKTVVK